MTESQDAPTSAVLGVTVVGDEIASVVLDGNGVIVASNIVDLADPSPAGASTAVSELIDSVPFAVDQVVVSCAEPDVQAHLRSSFVPDPSASWYGNLVVGDLPPALAETARAQPGVTGVVGIVDLDRAGAPAPGASVVVTDTATGDVLGSSEFRGPIVAVTDARSAAALADTLGALPGAESITAVVCTGSGAELPGVAESLSYPTQRPVQIAELPALAPAVGATRLLMPEPVDAAPGFAPAAARDRSGLRWWLIGAALGLAVLLGGVGLVLGLTSSRDNDRQTSPPAASTVTVTGSPERVTETRSGNAGTVTETVTDTETRTVTPPPAPGGTNTVTETETQTETETTVSTTTTIIETPAPPAEPPADGQQ